MLIFILGNVTDQDTRIRAYLLAIVTFPMNENLSNFYAFTTCPQSIFHTLTTEISLKYSTILLIRIKIKTHNLYKLKTPI